MSENNYWGPSVWIFLHTLVARVKDESYDKIKQSLFNQIKSICTHLPCPECTEHATAYVKTVQPKHISTKQHLIYFLYNFHNIVNKNNRKKMFAKESLTFYETNNLKNAYKAFITNYTKSVHNPHQMNSNAQRIQIGRGLYKWMCDNKQHINL